MSRLDPLGMDGPITRRDFIGGALAVAAACPAGASGAADRWTGYGGVGDYATSNGNTRAVVDAAHRIRDAAYPEQVAVLPVVDMLYDLVIVGGGFAGLSAAYEFAKNGSGSCLLLDNHPIFGGEAKQNDFLVDGVRLTGPQGSNDFRVPIPENGYPNQLWDELGLPRHFDYAVAHGVSPDLRIPRDNFDAMFWGDDSASVAYYFDGHAAPVIDMWADRLARAPIAADAKRDLLDWRYGAASRDGLATSDQALDRMSYQQFLSERLGLGAAPARYADPFLAAGSYGLGSDVVSAYAARALDLPGVAPLVDGHAKKTRPSNSFPGGNAGIARHIVKAMMPDAIGGGRALGDILSGSVRFKQLDQPDNKIRMRLGATAFHIAHDGNFEDASTVSVAYAQRGKLFRVKTRAVVMASGGWVNRHIVADLAPAQYDALSNFHHAPMLVVNVALRRWRFMERAGVSAAHWFDGDFGFYCNLRTPMIVDGVAPGFHPDKPAILTFYVPFPTPGQPLAEQAMAARMRLFGTSFAEFERAIRDRLVRMFGRYGFDPKADIAGIITNRWGHAFISPQPGFFFGADGKGGLGDIMRRGHGRIAFGHAELTGRQTWRAAVIEGRRAARQALGLVVAA